MKQKKDRKEQAFPNMDIIQKLESATQAPDDPFALFTLWLEEAEKSEPTDPNAMSLATIDPDGRPSVRIVLLKSHDGDGFVFYTNRQSRKGLALTAHPAAALCFHWKSLGRQVRVEGAAHPVSDAESDAYYNSRPVGSRIGAWASDQSRPLPDRATLVARVAEQAARFPGPDIPRPPHWGGYRLVPDRIEFWHDGAERLHTRVLYTRKADGDGWSRGLLYP